MDDYEVGMVMTLCYVDPKLKGESFFRNDEEKVEYEAAERAGSEVYRGEKTESDMQLQQLKELFSGVHVLTASNTRKMYDFRDHMGGITSLMRENEKKLESLRLRLQGLRSVSHR